MKIETKSVRRGKETVADEKSIKTLQTIANYLTAILLTYVVGVLLNIWQIVAKGSSAPSTALLNIFAFIVLGPILIWCLRLMKQRRLSSFWIFLMFVLANLTYLVIYRLISRAALFAPVDIIMYLFIAGVVFELFKLKRNGTLY